MSNRDIAIFLLILFQILNLDYTFAESQSLDPNLTIEHIISGQFKPSNMAFVGPEDILVLDRNDGKVYRVTNGLIITKPILDVNIATIGYRGLLGIDTLKLQNGSQFVFLYYTESGKKDGEDESGNGGVAPLGNRLYRYELVSGKLVNPKLLLDLPVNPGPRHTGGEVAIGPDNNLYLTIGDLDGTFNVNFEKMSQNYRNVTVMDGRSGILRVTLDGKVVGDGIIGDKFPLNLYFAYGIRNSFGLDWDPVTGKLWDSENGPHYGDEINLVEAGFNSGWAKVQGVWTPNLDEIGKLFNDSNQLVSFNGKGKYSEPEFIWIPPVAPTAITFLDSENYGPSYKNDLFVSDANTGTIFHFELNKNRTGLQLNEPLQDKTANNMNELKDVSLVSGFGRITDMQVGPDGYLYILSSDDDGTSIDRLMPK